MGLRSCLTVRRLPALPAVLAAALSACSGSPDLPGAYFEPPETSVAYEVEIVGMPDEEMTELAEETLLVYRYRDDGAFSLPMLRRRAESDIETVLRILHSRGYYDGAAEVVVEEVEEGEIDPGGSGFSFSDLMFWRRDRTPEPPDPERFARVLITVDPGTQFTLAGHEFAFVDPATAAVVPAPALLGSPVGGPAVAVPIVGAEAAAVELLQANGYPYSEALGRDAVADLALATVEVESALRSGPSAVFGPVEFDGLADVRESYLRTYIPWEPGEIVDREELREFQRSLISTDLFETVIVTLPADPPDVQGPVALPVHVAADERPFRTIGAGAEYSTDEGPKVEAEFEHRNLWGENETVSVAAELGLELQRLGVGYIEPQYLHPGQDFVAALELVHEEDDAFDETRATLTAGLERRLSPEWVVGFGGLLEASRISDDGVDRDAYLAGIPVFAEYDDTDDLLNPTEGHRARIEATPFAGLHDDEFTGFLQLDSHASTYWDILDNDAHVLAARARLGSIAAGELDDVPKNRRLYSGGGGSVRGYERRFIGPLDEDNDPVGGLSVVEASLEMRSLIYGDSIGGVVFVDAGSVSTESWPDFDEGVQVAAGVGFRYYSLAGPIRLDVAFPVNPRDVDDAFQLYFSIGQAF